MDISLGASCPNPSASCRHHHRTLAPGTRVYPGPWHAGSFLSTETQPQEHRPSNRAARAGEPAGSPRTPTKNFTNSQNLRDPASAELSHSLKVRLVVETRRKRHRNVRNRRVPVSGCRAGYFGLGLALSPNPVRNRRYPAGSLQVFGALSAEVFL